jgi:hypothetical protein
MRRVWGVVFSVVVFAALSSACETTTYQQIQTLERDASPLRVVLMPLDVQISELTAAGLHEPKADWTSSARVNIRDALIEELRGHGAEVAVYVEGPGDPQVRRDQIQLVKLHEAVGETIMVHKFQPALELPTKKDTFDWSLGPKVGSLRDEYDADYALFVFVRDSHSSGGRVAAAVLVGILSQGLYILPGGQQTGFASLVDLDTGDIVWFNRLQRGAGDLRTFDAARDSVSVLVTDFPK